MRKRFIFAMTLLCIIITFCGCSKQSAYSKEDLFTFEFRFDELSVKIPQEISLFTNDGWKFPEKFKDLETTMSNGNLKSTYLEKEDNWFSVEIFNYSGSDKLVKDCPIGRITYDFSGNLKIYLANDYLLNEKTLDQFIKDFGSPMSQADYSTYTEIIYDKNEQEGIYDRITLRFDKDTKIVNSFDVVNFY